MLFPHDLTEAASALIARLRSRGRHLATAESCTGGLLAGLLTEIAGASDVIDRGWVTYSNEAKTALLGVSEATLAAHGAVSAETAEAMARGALSASAADLAIAVTGIAGPGGGTADKPVGLVHIGVAARGGAMALAECRFGEIGRTQVRLATLRAALALADRVAE